MPVTLMDKFKEFLGIESDPRASMTPQDIAKEKQDYSNEAMYFKKGSELKDKGPGNKINRSQVDAIVAAANMGVTMGLMDREMGDRFISNQFQELRNDFAVNAVDEKGKTIKLPVTPGDTYKAADALYGMESGRGATFYEPHDEKKGRKTIHIGREFSSEGKRYTTKDVNSPYAENIPPEQLQDNAKLALLTWISKRGKNVDETTMNWNGDRRYGAAEHLAKVKRREEDLMADYNKELRDYMNERIAYDSKYKMSKEEKDFQEGIRKTEWFKEYKKQYGEEPDLNTKDYDYRKAWSAGIRPVRDPYDNNRYHWSSSLDDGTMLKSKDHPTAWKEYYMRATGKNPDEVGATKQDWEKMQAKSKK